MRVVILMLVALAACTPDIVSASYLCGPNGSCPEDQRCNGPDNICVSTSPEPFACEPEVSTEPDDSAASAHPLGTFACTSLAASLASCMDQGDVGDWYSLVAPTGCSAVAVDARVTFPTAFEEIALELWNVDTNERVGQSSMCPVEGASGEEVRCMRVTLDQGAHYAIAAVPTGEGDCNGSCAYNRYELHWQLITPR